MATRGGFDSPEGENLERNQKLVEALGKIARTNPEWQEIPPFLTSSATFFLQFPAREVQSGPISVGNGRFPTHR